MVRFVPLVLVALLRTGEVYEETPGIEEQWERGAIDVASRTEWTVLRRGTSPRSGLTTVDVRVGTRTFAAEIDAYAVVRTRPGSTFPSTLPEVELVRPLMPSAGLWKVRSARSTEDGLALTSRLAAQVDGQTLLGVSANFWLPHVRASLPSPPNDPRYGGQWYFDTLQMEAAWKLSSGSADVEIAVLDDGCDLTHPDLASKMLPGLDVVSHDDDPSYGPNDPGNEHGTACAGLIGAATNNDTDIAGACPECKLRCIRLIPPSGGSVSLSDDIDAFEFVLSSGSDVASNSWGLAPGVPAPLPLVQAIQKVMAEGRGGKGAVVVFAAGNESSEIQDGELAAIPGVITVGAINNFDEATAFSNRGKSVALTAPTGTLTLDISGPDGNNATNVTSQFGGTSSSCPVVAGIAGLLLSANPELTAAQVRETLIATARPAPFAQPDAEGHDLLYGYGIVDPAAALEKVLPGSVGQTPPGEAPAPPAEENEDGGCGCHSNSSGPLIVGAVLMLLHRNRRRSYRRALAVGTGRTNS